VGAEDRRAPVLTERKGEMLKNPTYDLMETASVLSKGLHRYDTFRKDAAHCPQCQEIWTFMKSRDEEELKRVVDHLAHHFQDELKLRLTA
jgi:hypothetical protein